MPQYQGIWSLPQQSQALTNQQWLTDPDFKNTTLLLQADGTGSGSQNHTFLDSSTNNFFITRGGNATQGSFSPFSKPDGEWSTYNSGSSSYLSLNNSDYAISTGDFTIEFWMFVTVDKANTCFGSSPTNTNLTIATDGGSAGARNLYLEYGGTGTTFGTLRGYINKWTHVAFVRSSGTVTAYQNGVAIGTASKSAAVGSTANFVLLRNSGDSGQDFPGYISNFRICKAAVYTSNFIPSTVPLTTTSQGATNCQLLTFQSNRFIDNSTNASTVSVTGAPSIRALSPFSSRQWTSDVVGGSAYFDSSGDYLTTPDNANLALGTGAFTVECWFYGVNNTDGILSSINSGSASYGLGIYFSNTTTLRVGIQNYNTGAANIDSTIVRNQWYHVVVVRDGSNNFSVFLNGTRTGTTTNSTNISLQTWGIGSTYSNPGSTYEGYISGVRIVKGTAVYSATSSTLIVPTAPPTAITNTQLLLNYSNAGIYDSTGQTNWETKALRDGTVVNTIVKKNGSGSFYFDGTQAYAPTERILPSENYASLIFGTGDFTIETWLYCLGKPVNSTTSGIWDQRPGVNGTYINFVVDFGGYGGAAATPTLVLYADSATRLRSNVIPLQRWFHAVLCRRSGITRFLIDGKLACTPLVDTRDYLGGGSAGNFRPVIGQTDGGDAFYGFMDDFRASRFCRYNSDFIPPKQAFPRQ